VFASEYNARRVTVHDLDSGALIAEVQGKGGDFVDMIDGVLMIVETDSPGASRIQFVAIDSIPGVAGRTTSL
jgi:hypothetical protein